MYEITTLGNYIIVRYMPKASEGDGGKVLTEEKATLRGKFYQFPMIKTVYSFNGTYFKISEGEVMTETLILDLILIEQGQVRLNGLPVDAPNLEKFLQEFTARFK